MFQSSISSPPPPFETTPGIVSRRTLILMVLGCLFVGLKTAFDLYLKSAGLVDYVMTDIDTFWLVGWLYWDGRLADAYSAATLFAAQADVLQTQSFMPYTYPPQYNFVTVALGTMPVWLAYAVFIVATAALYCKAVQTLSAGHLALVFVMVFPAFLVNIRTGQNGFLVAGIVALAAQGILGTGLRGGVALGLAAIKPHVAIGIGAAALLTGRFQLAAVAIATCAASLAAAALVFGVDLFPMMITASQEAMGFLRSGAYPLHRMVSVYAFARTFGASADVAMMVQAAAAVIACGTLILLTLRRPYAYDYDMTLAGVALALIATRLVARWRSWEMLALLVIGWVAMGWGIAMSFLTEQDGVQTSAENMMSYPSIQAPLNIVLVLLIAHVLRRSSREVRQ
jgi:hypothetical protein